MRGSRARLKLQYPEMGVIDRLKRVKRYVFTLPLRLRSARTIFTRIYRRNLWGDPESASGTGSNLQQTRAVREALPGLLRGLDVKVLVDAPCGDFHWIQQVDLPVERYIGLDIVEELIEKNHRAHGRPGREFKVQDIIHQPPPKADLILCRDALVHFSYANIFAALENFRKSGTTYVLTTTFTKLEGNMDVATGDWRPVNLQRPPFNFPAPLRMFDEQCTEEGGRYRDKALGLWILADLPLDRR